MTNDHRIGGNFPQGGDKCFGNLHGMSIPYRGIFIKRIIFYEEG
jgi:hypothetical protein